MVNFGERIAYWYLRLNGFLLVENFVLHQAKRRTADADLLGVRLRYSAESIGGEPLPLHGEIQKLVGEEPDVKHVALVVQVKTGVQGTGGEAFCSERLRQGLRFVGVFPGEILEQAEEDLAENPISTSFDGWVVAKLLIAEEPNDKRAVCVPLRDALQFIEHRLTLHPDRKAADRMFFPDELMQFLAWRANQHERQHG